MSEATQPDLGFDPDDLRAKYRAERDKRLRDEGNEQYVEVSGRFAHFVDDPYVERSEREPLKDDVDVVVIGGGFGGLLAGARLREAGVEDIRIIEKGGDFGGTWYWNRYPGAQCDIESYIYLPLLEELGYVPKEKYSFAPEILAHARAIGERFRLYDNACFQTEVTAMRWDDDDRRWIIETNRGDVMRARFVAMSNGPLNRPKLPGIPGVGSFKGPHLPHQPMGLRIHGWGHQRQPDPPQGQAHRHHRNRGDRGAMRSARRRTGRPPVRLPAHAVIHRRAWQQAHGPGLGRLA